MNNAQLKKGNELLKLIEITKAALIELIELQPEKRSKEADLDDCLYNLHISKHRDGSGVRADLCRYYGNQSLLNVIIKELERQLAEFEDMFAEL
jgi:hypothetical protein